MNVQKLYRRRLIPDECILLKDDIIIKANCHQLENTKPKNCVSIRLFLLLLKRRHQSQ